MINGAKIREESMANGFEPNLSVLHKKLNNQQQSVLDAIMSEEVIVILKIPIK